MRHTILSVTFSGFIIFLIVLQTFRLYATVQDLNRNAIQEVKTHAFLLGNLAEELYLQGRFEALENRLNESLEKTAVSALFFGSNISFLDDFKTTYGNWGEISPEFSPHDSLAVVHPHLVQADYFYFDYRESSNTGIWVKLPVNYRPVVYQELRFLFGAIVFGLIVIGLIQFFLERVVIKPVRRITQQMKIMAQGKGDLTQRLGITAKGEIGALAHAFDQLMDHYHHLISEVIRTAEEVRMDITNLSAVSEEINTSSQQMVITIQEISDGAQHQSEQTGSIFKSSSEVAGVSDQVYQAAKSAQDAATLVAEAAHNSEQSMEEINSRISEISHVSRQAVGIVQHLSEKTRRIRLIVRTIDDISRQVNLLALNAAIEASHAGEHGRGFAVVAEEIRRLASQTDESTHEIAQLIEEIEETTQETATQTDRVTDRVVAGERVIRRSTSILETIVTEAKRSTTLVQSIRQLASEQKEIVQALVNNLEEISRVAEVNAANSEEVSAASEQQTASMEEIAATVQSVLDRVNVLTELVQRFKIT